MIKKSLIVRHDIRFDEVLYSDDNYFSLLTGYYADKIKVVNEVFYVVTFRPNSIMADYCSKSGEIEQRAEVAFRMDKFMLRNGFCREHRSKPFLNMMLKYDRRLFKYYFFRLEEIYPSKLSALRDISKDKSLRFKVKFYLYSFLVWIRIL